MPRRPINLKTLQKQINEALKDKEISEHDSRSEQISHLPEIDPALSEMLERLSKSQRDAVLGISSGEDIPDYPSYRRNKKRGGKIKTKYARGGGIVGSKKIVKGYKKGGQV